MEATGIAVRPVHTRADRRRFIDYAYDHYRGHPHWVPPLRRDVRHTLNPRANPFFEHGRIQPFLAEDAGGRVVGRIAAIVNGMHLKKYDDGVGFFGFFECEDRFEAARALIEAAGAWLQAQGLTAMRGPANPSLNDIAGLLVDGFDRTPAILMPYNPPYHEDFLLRGGFERVMTMWAYAVHEKYVRADRLRRGVEIIYRRNPGLSVRTLDMSRFDEEARTFLDIYNEGWSENWGHVPMTDAEFDKLARDMKQIVDPNLVFIVEHEGTPVAFSIALPDLNQALKHVRGGRLFPFGLVQLLARARFGGIHRCRMPLLGVRRAFQGKALDSILILETIDHGMASGYDLCETSWILDTNHVLKNAHTALGAVVDKEYALFEKRLA